MVLALNHRRQPVYRFSHISPAAGDIDTLNFADISYHADFTARSTVAIVFSSVPEENIYIKTVKMQSDVRSYVCCINRMSFRQYRELFKDTIPLINIV